MSRLRRVDLPDHLQAEVARQIAEQDARMRAPAAPSKPKPKGKARSQRKPGEMTSVESRYRDHLLEQLARREIEAWAYEPVILRMAPRLTYCPDFAVRLPGGLVELVEVKPTRRGSDRAWWTEDSRVKVKAAAQLYGTLFRFVASWCVDGEWRREVLEREAHS